MYVEDVSFLHLHSKRQMSSVNVGDDSSVTDSLVCVKTVTSPEELLESMFNG
jgi:hypothetical protein